MKYKNLKELVAAFNSGELSRDDWSLMVDNDCSSLVWTGPVPEGVDESEFCDEKYEQGMKLFRGGGSCDAMEAHEAAGIPCIAP